MALIEKSKLKLLKENELALTMVGAGNYTKLGPHLHCVFEDDSGGLLRVRVSVEEGRRIVDTWTEKIKELE